MVYSLSWFCGGNGWFRWLGTYEYLCMSSAFWQWIDTPLGQGTGSSQRFFVYLIISIWRTPELRMKADLTRKGLVHN